MPVQGNIPGIPFVDPGDNRGIVFEIGLLLFGIIRPGSRIDKSVGISQYIRHIPYFQDRRGKIGTRYFQVLFPGETDACHQPLQVYRNRISLISTGGKGGFSCRNHHDILFIHGLLVERHRLLPECSKCSSFVILEYGSGIRYEDDILVCIALGTQTDRVKIFYISTSLRLRRKDETRRYTFSISAIPRRSIPVKLQNRQVINSQFRCFSGCRRVCFRQPVDTRDRDNRFLPQAKKDRYRFIAPPFFRVIR